MSTRQGTPARADKPPVAPGVSFDKTAQNLHRTALVQMSGEHVHRCRRAVFGEDDAAGKTWAESLFHTFKHDGFTTAWNALTTWRATLRTSRQKATADRLLNYVSDRREMISDPEFRTRGWQIGSGPTESRCKTSTTRLKARSRRWDPQNAEAVAALTCLQDSHQWPLYWPTATQPKTSACQ